MELEKSHEQVKGCDEISILSAGIYNNKPAATVRAKVNLLRGYCQLVGSGAAWSVG